MTAEELLKVFYSGRQASADWDILDELEVATKTGVFEVTKFVFSSRQEYEKAQFKIDDFKEAYRVTGHGG